MAQGRSTKIISTMKWIRNSRLSIKNSLSKPFTLQILASLGVEMHDNNAQILVSQVASPEYGTYKTVKDRFWPWISGESPFTVSSCSLFAAAVGV